MLGNISLAGYLMTTAEWDQLSPHCQHELVLAAGLHEQVEPIETPVFAEGSGPHYGANQRTLGSGAQYGANQRTLGSGTWRMRMPATLAAAIDAAAPEPLREESHLVDTARIVIFG
jgi:hypothetical protein